MNQLHPHRRLDRRLDAAGTRLAVALVGAGLVASALSILAAHLGLGSAGFGWKRITLLAAGVIALTTGTLLLTRPGIVMGFLTPERMRVAGIAGGAVIVVGWLFLSVRQVTYGGFYSDDWGNLEVWTTNGYFDSVSTFAQILGSKPLLALILPAPFEILGTSPAAHHALAAGLVLATVVAFYFVLRELRFTMHDALPIALLALLFPWASAVRLWPTGSLNNVAVLLLFAGLLIALRGLRVGGRRGLLMHLGAAGCYAASILTYEATSVVALMLWPAYVWLHGWRPGLPRAVLDVSAAGAALLYSAANTVRPVVGISEQLSHALVILRDGARLVAASLVPLEPPAGFRYIVTAAILGAAIAAIGAVLVKRRRVIRNGARADPALRWIAVVAVALVMLGLSLAIYVPSGVFNPSLAGLHDRVNVLALYPAVVLIYATLRSIGYLWSGRSYAIAVAGSLLIAVGYGLHDLRQQRDYFNASEAQEAVLASVEGASPPDHSVVLTFGHPAEVTPGVPVFNKSFDLPPAARLRIDSSLDTYPVFEGAELECLVDGLRLNYLSTPYGDEIEVRSDGMPPTYPYPRIVFVDVEDDRHAVIQSRDQCDRALDEFPPGPWVRSEL